MARRDQVTRSAGVDSLIARADAPEIIRVQTVLIEVERHPRGYGQIEHDPEPDLDLLLNVPDSERMIRELPADMRGRRRFEENLPTSTDEYDEIAQDADLSLVVEIKGTAQTLEALVDSSSATSLARGGARSLKTHTGSYWAFRQWMLRGSATGLAWFVGSDMSVAHVLKDKWLKGEGEGVPPICPEELVVSYPSHEREMDQHIHMIDGFKIRLLHAGAKGKNMPGRSVDFIQWTEAAVTDSGKPFARARGRITTSKGQMYLDAVPEARGWIRNAITEPAVEEETKIADAVKRGEPEPRREYAVHQLSSADNPWNDVEDTKAFISALEAMDPRLAAREARGEDVGDANRIFGELFEASAHTFDFEGFHVPEPGAGELIAGRPLLDITRQASKRVFKSPKDWLAAVDVNARPHTTILAKIACPPGLDSSRPDNWVLVFFDAFQKYDVDSEEAANVLAARWDGRYSGAGVIMDASSCYEGHNAGGARNAAKGMMPREMYERAGFEVVPPDYYRSSKKGRRNPRNPPTFSGTILQRRMLRERRVLWSWLMCRNAIRGVRDQLDNGDGLTPAKTSNTDQDRMVAAWVEVWRYLAWPFCAVRERQQQPLTVRKYA